MNPTSPRPFDADRLPAGVSPPTATDPDHIGPYRVVGRIGAGGMGAVYAGIDPSGACAAVKVVHPHYAADPDFRARFAREVSLVSRVRATCTAGFLGADTDAEAPWMAAEYVPGGTLRAHVKKNGPLTGGMAISLAAGLAEALTAIHAAGIVHRDLKPGNVILAPDGPRVLDFGIARATDATALTRTGGLFGTPGWMAPEQYARVEATDRSDVFAWGCLVAFAATGRDPFAGGPVEAVIHRTRTEEPDLTGVPDEILYTVRRALAKDPAVRPTAAEALAEVTGAWSATRVGAPPETDPTRVVPAMLATEWRGMTAAAPRRIRRSPRVPLLAAGAAATAAAVIGTWFVVGPDAGAEDPGTAPEATASPEATDPGGPAVDGDPQDAAAVIGEAVASAEDASSFIVHHVRRSAETASDSSDLTLWYTEEPEPLMKEVVYAGPAIFTVLQIGEGPDDVLARIDSNLTGLVEGDYYRPVPEEDVRDPRADWAASLEPLRELLGDADAVTYQGMTPTPYEDYPRSSWTRTTWPVGPVTTTRAPSPSQ
ncbi:serine/threonine-protein kinase [Nocardiopsis sp. N85]|uniref:serine/threonine-protein kinase n=1 Tax=Nocardiopsis sp. N85 TaxID=3029400 RepID=UPI00237F1A48|nr:serine/threonine-protein kinase [Nocardiopsis sp. N85]MDE3721179.1 serine/threonine-protein kinase [Nocardiopsis sp. N85]